MKQHILLLGFALALSATTAVGCSPKACNCGSEGKTSVSKAATTATAAIDSSAAATALLKTYAWRNLMPSTDPEPKPVRLQLTWKVTGPGRIVEPEVTILKAGKPVEINRRELTAFPQSKTQLAENDTHEYRMQCEFSDPGGTSLELQWFDLHSGQWFTSDSIEIQIVQ
ncbi:MAG: hypothetical protein OEM52_05255 [bacterium]|nr:hypothetical protein [bacterium]